MALVREPCREASRYPDDFRFHIDLGARLAPLRERGALILASGNVVHNLRALDWSQLEAGYDWARRFDAAARQAITGTPGDVAALQHHEDFALAAPSPDHFIPLLYFAGLAAAAGRRPKVLVEGCAMGSLSMTAYTLDVVCGSDGGEQKPAAGLPEPATAAPEDTNSLSPWPCCRMTKPTIETGLTFLFAPGAGAPSCSDWMRTFAGQLKRRGRVESFDYPYQLAGRRSPDK